MKTTNPKKNIAKATTSLLVSDLEDLLHEVESKLRHPTFGPVLRAKLDEQRHRRIVQKIYPNNLGTRTRRVAPNSPVELES